MTPKKIRSSLRYNIKNDKIIVNKSKCQTIRSGIFFAYKPTVFSDKFNFKNNIDMQKGTIGVTTDNIFPIIKKFLYSDHEIFLRELVSNAVDATQKLKTLSSFSPTTIERSFKRSLSAISPPVKPIMIENGPVINRLEKMVLK